MGQKEMLETGLNDLFVVENADARSNVMTATSTDEGLDLESEPVLDKVVVPIGEETEQGEATGNPQSTKVEDEQTESKSVTDRGHPARLPEADGPENQWVVFRLGSEEYGLDISGVDSVIRLQSITAVPGAPPFVEGVTNLRGTVLPVVDLHKRLGLIAQETTPEARILVAEVGGNRVGMVVDAVVAVDAIPSTVIEPPSPLVATVDSTYIAGIAKVEDERLIVLLDLERTLAYA